MANDTKELSEKLFQAHNNHQLLPNVSRQTNIDMSHAYEIQAAYVKDRLHKDHIAGFKAGLTNAESQAQFHINRPIFGVLLKSGNFSNKEVIPLSDFHDLLVETELGFITKKAIKQPVNSASELKAYIAQVVPVIELPDVGFEHKPITAPDLVAANTASTGYIVRTDINWYGEDINAITVSLMRNGLIVNQGQGVDAMGDQWEALRWLVNQVLAHGWTIEKDNLLITGALGGVVPAKQGVYKAQFNDGACIEFTFKE
ncbi:MAG: 2-keto-4-pentenoate hydratase [Candidatus Berkiella sp.]